MKSAFVFYDSVFLPSFFSTGDIICGLLWLCLRDDFLKIIFIGICNRYSSSFPLKPLSRSISKIAMFNKARVALREFSQT